MAKILIISLCFILPILALAAISYIIKDDANRTETVKNIIIAILAAIILHLI